MSDDVTVPAEALLDFARRVVRAMGAGPDAADEVARHLVNANLSGHDSHGVLRLTQYLGEQDRGELVPPAETRLLRDRPVAALFDAQRGFGQHSTMVSTRWVIPRAREHGLAAAAVRHSMHIGRLGEYTEQIVEHGLIGVVTVGVAGPGSGTVAPFGGSARFLGTNPWSMGVPAAGRPPLVFDAATSTIAEGKARLALAKGAQVPAGTLRDPAGQPSTDPADLYAGGTLTGLGSELAGHKGFGLSLAAALIGGVAMIDDAQPTTAGTMRPPDAWGPRLAGVFVVAVDPSAFGDALDYQRRVAEVLDSVTNSQPLPGTPAVLVPGDPERASRERRRRDGIPVPRAIWADLAEIAARFGLEMP